MGQTLLQRIGKRHRRVILMFADIFLISSSYILSWLILMRRIPLTSYTSMMLLSGLCFISVFFFSFLFFGLYESLWRYAEAHEFIKCLLATAVATAIFVAVTWMWFQPPYSPTRIPITVYFLSAMLAGVSTLFMRMAYRAYRSTRKYRSTSSNLKKAMIVGAGQSGSDVLQEIYREPDRRYDVICYVDDDPNKIGRKIQQVKVEGTTDDIIKLVDKHGINIIILAMPTASDADKQRIMHICSKTKCQLKKVPSLYTMVSDAPSLVSQMTDVNIEDLLGREVVDVGNRSSHFLANKVVLVTGAGGSIGSELCRQIIRQQPKSLVMVDISENGLYDIQQELIRERGNNRQVSLYAEVASVRDEKKIEVLFSRYLPEVVYHAAAHKHVPLMESAPEEAVKNNIYGTLNVARCADRHQVDRFVMISTDKAVHPTSIMGATKRVCEMIVQSMNQVSKTDYVAVRFGNVLGSSGSVIPLFKDQIAAGGPVTVTHPEIIRYFMTISEAVSLVLTAGEMARGGEIFVLDMGNPVKILDLAETLIRLSGYEPYKDIAIQFTGLRPGEKLYEELLMNEEGLKKTPNKKIFVGSPIDISPDYLFDYLNKLKIMADVNYTAGIAEKLGEMVIGFGRVEHETEQES